MATALQLSHKNLFQEAMQNGLQSYVLQGNPAVSGNAFNAAQLLSAQSTVTGFPFASGTFYSTVVGRAPIPNLANDLRPSFGIERIQTQSLVPIQNEFGPNGETVFATPNDDRGLIRFVGNWFNSIGTDGAAATSAGPASPGDFCEVVFYGTSLNVLWETGGSTTYYVTVDGGTETVANLFPSGSTVLNGRNYGTNQITPVTATLALGIHTVKIRKAAAGGGTYFYGFEIVNANSTTSLNVNPGTAYIDGLKVAAASAQSVAYNSAFESGTLGTRGGRVVAYLKSDGTIGKAVQPVDSAPKGLGFSGTNTNGTWAGAVADHSNEELVRVHDWREFGSSRYSQNDDFSLLTTSGGNRAFTLDDGATTLVGNSVAKAVQNTAVDTLQMTSAGAFITITFVGSGIDLISYGDLNAAGDAHAFILDGVTLSTLSTTTVANQRFYTKVASGLPYGTHTFKLNRNTAATGSAYNVLQWNVYGPKKPALPAGAVELADYNVMANYVANSTASQDAIASGVLRKHTATREAVYVGTVSGPTLIMTEIGGFNTDLATSGGAISYTFFGTGVEVRGRNVAVGVTVLTVDGAFPSAGQVSLYGGTMAYNATNGQISGSGAQNGGIVITGLTLGVHTVKFSVITAGDFLTNAFDIITPIHSPRSNLQAAIQNALPVGSQGISDNRKTSAIRLDLPTAKYRGVAVGVASGPSTTSTAFVPLADMSLVVFSKGGWFDLGMKAVFRIGTSANVMQTMFYLNGTPVGVQTNFYQSTANLSSETDVSNTTLVYLAPGTHKVDIYWKVGGGSSASSNGIDRILTVKEL